MPSGLTKRLFETADRPEAEKEASAEATIRALTENAVKPTLFRGGI